MIYGQLREELDKQVSGAVAAAMVAAAATTVTDATAFSVPHFWGDVMKAANSLETTTGNLLFATHVFMPPANFRFAASQVDTNDRPLWTPDTGARPDPSTGETGYSVAGSGVFVDGAIPPSGTDARIVVANPAHGVLVARGEPVVQAFPQPGAEDLTVLLRLYQYVAVVVRYPSAAAVVSGAAYPAAPVFA